MVNVAELTVSPVHHDRPEASAAIGQVLVCLDGSPASDACLAYARFVAAAFGANITLLRVMQSPSDAQEPHPSDVLEWEIAKREADLYLARASASLGLPRERVKRRVTEGSPAEQIVAAARALGADLTILASRGQGGASDIGSIAHHVLAMACGSVLLAQPSCLARIPPRRIMVPLDGSSRSECVLPIAMDLARSHNAELLLVHVVLDPTPTGVLAGSADLRLALSLASRIEANAESYLAAIRLTLLPKVPAVQSIVVRRAEERRGLLDVAAEQEVDMLALSAHGTTCNQEHVFGSVASYLISHAPLPLFLMQDIARGPNEASPDSHTRSPLSIRPSEGE